MSTRTKRFSRESIAYVSLVAFLATTFLNPFIIPVAHAASPWWDTAWTKRIKLDFNNASRTENITDFPVLVILNSGNIDYSQTKNDGSDLRFIDDDGTTVLSYEIEKWDEAGTSYVWVNVPQINASSNTDHMHMYYNNAAASAGANPNGTWHSGYQSVQHLGENPSGSAPQFQDSTTNNRDGTAAGGISTSNSVATKVGNGIDLNGVLTTGNNIDLGLNFPGNLPNGAMEMWINPDNVATFKSNRYLFSRGITSSLDGESRLYIDTNTGTNKGKITYQLECVPTQNNIIRSNAAVTATGGWYHVVVVWDDDTTNSMKMYVNGVLQTVTASPQCGMVLPNGTNTVKLGMNNALGDGQFDGQIDEFRITNTPYSAAKVSASYATQNNTLITYNTSETYTVTVSPLTSTNIEPTSLIPNGIGTVDISFTTSSAIPADGKIVIDFPTVLGSWTFDSGGTTLVTSASGIDGSLTVTPGMNTLTITRSGGTSSAAGAKSFTLSNIQNPATVGSTGTYTIRTKTATDTTIDENTAVPADVLIWGDLTATNVEPRNLELSVSEPIDVAFTTAAPIPADGKIVITFPAARGNWLFELGLTDAIMTNVSDISGMDGTFTLSTALNTITLTRTGGTTSSAGAKSFTINNLRTPPTAGSTETYTIAVKNSTDTVIQQATVSADILSFDAANGGVQSATISAPYNTISTTKTVTLPTAATAGNLIVTAIAMDKSSGTITPPTGFTLVNDYVGASVSSAMAYKVAVGGETAITWNWVTAQETSVWAGEYDGYATTDVIDVKVENNSAETSVLSLSTGTTSATSEPDELAIALVAVDSIQNTVLGRSWTNGFKNIAHVGPSNGVPLLAIASKGLASTGSVESTFSTTYQADQMYTSLVTFKKYNPNTTTPSAPQSVTATPGDSTMDITWSGPASNGGSAVTAYKVYENDVLVATTASTTFSLHRTGLTNNTEYTYYVIAVNAVGDSVPSASSSATPVSIPVISLVQNVSGTTTNAATSVTCTLSSVSPGNLIVTTVASDKAAGSYTVPTGFTLVQSGSGTDTTSAGTVSGAMAYKIATGGETTITWTQANASSAGIGCWAAEYSGLATTDVLDVSAENESQLLSTAASTSISTGTTGTTTQAGELAISLVTCDTYSSCDGGGTRNYTNGFTEVGFFSNTAISGSPGMAIASKLLSSTGAIETTYSFTDTGDQMYAMVATFKVISAPDTIAPSAVSDLATTSMGASTANLSWTSPGDDHGSEQPEYIIFISVDGMGSEYVESFMVPSANELTTMERIISEGSGTLNARTDADYAITLPNHVDMATGRGVAGTTGHNWTLNVDPAVGETLASNKGSYIASVFDVAHDNGLRTGIWAGKSKFSLFGTSYNATYGADDVTGTDNGKDKIDYEYISDGVSAATLTTEFINQMTTDPYHFSFVHYQDPDATGHASGWSTDTSSAFATTVKSVDTQIGNILDMIDNSNVLRGKTTVIITADHGGHSTTHGDISNPIDFTIPFYVWGANASPGRDLYSLNSSTRTAPSASVLPPFSGGQPIRNGDAGNLALDLLNLGAIPNSTINASQNLSTQAFGTATSYDIRYSTSTITEGNWSAATPATGEPTPALAGTLQTFEITGLTPSTTYYFAMKTSDEVPNTSSISNIASGTPTVDTESPTISTLSPADNTTSVSITANIVMTFDEAITIGTGNITIKKTSDDSTVETIAVDSGLVTGGGTSIITINPTVTLSDSTEYYVLVDATAFDDLSGNSYAGIASTTAWSFLTAADYGALTSVNVLPQSLELSVTEPIDVSFTTTAPIPADGKIVVDLPASTWVYDDALAVTVTNITGIDGTLTLSRASNTITLTRTGGTTSAAGVKSFKLNNIRTPSAAGSPGSYTLKTTTAANATIQQGTAPTNTFSFDTDDGGVQSATTSSSAIVTTKTVTLPAPATAGNLLVTSIAMDKTSGTITIPTGFTLVHDYISTMVSGAMAYKVATGGETSITWNWVTGQEASVWVGEYAGLVTSSPLDVKVENDSGVTVEVTTLSTGTTTTTTQADELALTMLASDSISGIETGRTWSNGFKNIAHVGTTAGIPFLGMASKSLTATGTQQSTFTTTGSGDNLYAVLVTFKKAVTYGALTATNVEPQNLVPLATGSVDVSFTTINDIPADGKIVIDFPSGFTLNAGGTTAASSLSGIDGSLTASVTGDVLTLTRTGGTTSSAGVKSFTLTSIQNPNVGGSTGVYTIQTLGSLDEIINQGIATATELSAVEYAIPLKHYPYLQIGNAPLTGYDSGKDQKEIMWQTVDAGGGDTDSFEVDYTKSGGSTVTITDGSLSKIITGVEGRINHSAVLTNLDYDSDYTYQVRHIRGGSTLSTYDGSFHTRLPAGNDTPFSFVHFGDATDNTNQANTRAVQSIVNTTDARFAISAGDYQQDNGTHANYDRQLDPTINPEANFWNKTKGTYFTWGNHDTITNSGQAALDNFSNPKPVLGVTSPVAAPVDQVPERDYSFDYGLVHYVVIDVSEGVTDATRLTKKLDWAVADLEASTQPWNIVFTHYPIVSVAYPSGIGPTSNYFQQMVDRLKPAGADLIMSGHAHAYERSYPITGYSGTTVLYTDNNDSIYEKGAGIVQLINGLGGASYHAGTSSPAYLAVLRTSATTPAAEFGFNKIDVTRQRLTFTQYSSLDGGVVDTFIIEDTTITPDTILPPSGRQPKVK